MTPADARACHDRAAGITLEQVQALMARHVALYRHRAPRYQTELLRHYRSLWETGHNRVLDIGGGTGILAQAIKELFGVDRIVSIDIHDRFLPTLDIETQIYDGATLPFADASFDCAVFSNVLHHVPPAARQPLIRECARVTAGGPIYIKDHLARSRLDHVRLLALDAIGNVPFGGMVTANYLDAREWERLAASAGYRIGDSIGGAYRSGPYAWVFPNRLEVTLKLVSDRWSVTG